MLFLLLPLIFTFTNTQGTACTSNIDCFDPAFSICSTADYTCQLCSSNDDCTQFSATPTCSTVMGCVECAASTDCTDPTKSYCDPGTYTCVICSFNDDCTQFSATPTCSTVMGCVECIDSSQCTTVAQSYCNGNTMACEICNTDNDCTKFGNVCSSTLGCVGCIDSTQCTTAANPYCNIGTGVCTSCRVNNDCSKFPDKQVCSSNGQCVECADSTKCVNPEKSVCNLNSKKCQVCSSDLDCAAFPTKAFCSLTSNGCIGCSSNSQCGDITTSYCDTSAGTCKLYENTTSLSPEELKQIETLASVGDATGVTATVAIMLANVLSPGDSGGASGGILAKILQYIKYINVNYSLRLEAMFKSYHSPPGSLSFLAPKISDSAINSFPNREVPARFEEYNVHSAFIINFWSSLISFLILSGIFIVIRTIEWAFRKRNPNDKLRTASRQTRIAAQNFLILQFYNIYCDVVLFSSLQITRTDWVSFNSVVSFLVSVVFVILGFLLLYVHVIILYQYQLQYKRGEKGKQGKRDPALEVYIVKNEGFKAFFKNFKEDSFARQAFLLVFSVRSFSTNFIIVFLYEYPLTQAALITSMTVIIFAYLLIMRPFKLIINLSQQIAYEVLFLISNVCLLTLAVLDNLESSSINLRENLCNIIIIVSLVFGFIPNLFLVAKIVSAALAFYRKSGPKKSTKVKSSLNNFNIRDARSNLPDIDSQRQQNAGRNQLNNNSHNIQYKTNSLEMNLTRPESLKQDIGINQPSSTSQLQERQLGTQSPQRRPKIKRFAKQTTHGDKIINYNNHINLDTSEIRHDDNSISFGNSSTMHILNDESEIDLQRTISQTQKMTRRKTESPKRRNISDLKKG